MSESFNLWGEIKPDTIKDIISGTAFEQVVELFRSPTKPRLSLNIGLAKALTLCGSILSERAPMGDRSVTDYDKERDYTESEKRGPEAARLRILTGGGQVCSFYTMLVAESGQGKDIGQLVSKLSHACKILAVENGSPEGMMDLLIDNPNAIFTIGEMKEMFDKSCWKHRATDFLTKAFNQGFFFMPLSQSKDKKERSSPFSYPSVCANIQPGVLRSMGVTSLMDSGFIPRFMVFSTPRRLVMPRTDEIDIEPARKQLECLRAKRGTVWVPDNYLMPLRQLMFDCAAPHPSHWNRLINEYGPRLAVILSIKRNDERAQVVLDDEAWFKAELFIKYVYQMAWAEYGQFAFDERGARLSNIMERILQRMRKHGPQTRTDIARAITQTNSQERKQALQELLERDDIRYDDKQNMFVLS